MRTEPLRKTAIALPSDLLDAIDRAARERGESRSRYIVRILRAAVRARRDREITRRLDELFANEAIAAEQRRTAAELEAAATSWVEEGW